jgi:tRNA(adenine34) deaminase
MSFPYLMTTPKDDDEKFMLEALKEAWKAFKQKEVPVGAVLVQDGKVIARGHNQVEMLKDATAHAEMLCMTAGSSAVENWRLADTVLYCTIEPCSMCAGAMLLARVPVLVWGAPDIRHGANGSWINLFDKQHPTHSLIIREGVLAEQSAALMREFFQKRRLENEGKTNGESI